MERGESKEKRKEWDGQGKGEQGERMAAEEGGKERGEHRKEGLLPLARNKQAPETHSLVPPKLFFTPDLAKFSKNLSGLPRCDLIRTS